MWRAFDIWWGWPARRWAAIEISAALVACVWIFWQFDLLMAARAAAEACGG